MPDDPDLFGGRRAGLVGQPGKGRPEPVGAEYLRCDVAVLRLGAIGRNGGLSSGWRVPG